MKTEKYIIVKNCTKEELKKMLHDWLVMYVDRLINKMVFEIAGINSTVFVLKVDKSIDDTSFFYMVNYFFYPFDFNKSFEVEGYGMATKHKKLLNKNIYIFINENDTEGDNVWITTEDNETYKFDFAGTLKRMNCEKKYKTLNTYNLSIPYEQINIDKKELLEENNRKKEEKSKRRVEKRFKIISIILFILIPLTFLMNNHFSYCKDETLICYCSILVVMWFMIDYKIFDDILRTLICLLLSLLNIAYGINSQIVFMATIATIPLSSLIVMWLGNKILGKKMDYFYDKWDRLFILVLIGISVLISVFVFNPILKFLK